MTAPPDVPLLGIDGLCVSGRWIVVTQNGIAPHRVARLELDAAGDRVVRGGDSRHERPGIRRADVGRRRRDDFHFVGKSQWALYDEKTGAFDPSRLQEPVVLKIKL
ncbi:MAG: hypothetical protein ACRD3M_01135 [Thermoanaerobaculia bacterium]